VRAHGTVIGRGKTTCRRRRRRENRATTRRPSHRAIRALLCQKSSADSLRDAVRYRRTGRRATTGTKTGTDGRRFVTLTCGRRVRAGNPVGISRRFPAHSRIIARFSFKERAVGPPYLHRRSAEQLSVCATDGTTTVRRVTRAGHEDARRSR